MGEAIESGDWSRLKSYYPAAVEGREQLLIAALSKIESVKHAKAVDYYFYNTDAGAISDNPRPRFHVLMQKGFAAAGGAKKYGDRFNQLAPNDILLMYENRVGVVAIGRVKERWDEVSHTTPSYYTTEEMKQLDGGAFEYRIGVDWFNDLSDSPMDVDEIKNRFGNTPRGVVRRIVEKRIEAEKIVDELGKRPCALPEEIGEPMLYAEGASRQVSVNAYERNRNAIRKCKTAKGTACIICGFDFNAAYGSEFAGFIHVHHLAPLSGIKREYLVDPIADLCPVCPNCHAVIHYGGRLRSIEEVRGLLHPNAKNEAVGNAAHISR